MFRHTCRNCSSEFSGYFFPKTCPSCGRRLPARPDERVRDTPGSAGYRESPSSDGRLPPIVIAIFVLVALIGVVSLFTSSNTPTSQTSAPAYGVPGAVPQAAPGAANPATVPSPLPGEQRADFNVPASGAADPGTTTVLSGAYSTSPPGSPSVSASPPRAPLIEDATAPGRPVRPVPPKMVEIGSSPARNRPGPGAGPGYYKPSVAGTRIVPPPTSNH